VGTPAPQREPEEQRPALRIRRAADDDALADRQRAAGAEAGAVPIGDLGIQAADLAVDGIATRERQRAAIRDRMIAACPALRERRAEWVWRRAAEMIVDGGHDAAALDKTIRDWEVMRERLGTKIGNPGGYFRAIIARHFGRAWDEWHRPETG